MNEYTGDSGEYININGLDVDTGESINTPLSLTQIGQELEKKIIPNINKEQGQTRELNFNWEKNVMKRELEDLGDLINPMVSHRKIHISSEMNGLFSPHKKGRGKEKDFSLPVQPRGNFFKSKRGNFLKSAFFLKYIQDFIGWGIVFPEGIDEKYVNAFKPLVSHRQGNIYYYKQDTHVFAWESYAIPEGEIPPPFLLLVGTFQEIPLYFQNELDISYSVGRVWFFSPEQASRYVSAVLEYESGLPCKRPKKVCVFSPSFDLPTAQSKKYLCTKIVRDLSRLPDCNIKYFKSDGATKTNFLKEVVGKSKEERPDFLMIATHGCASANPGVQEQIQGAWLFQDKEPLKGRKICPGIFSSFDLNENTHLSQTIVFSFACYSGGTLKHSIYYNCISQAILKDGLLKYRGKRDFMGNLPISLLNSEYPCLGVIAHVDPVWNIFMGKNKYMPYKMMVQDILRGMPVGEAMKYLNARSAVLSVQLTYSMNEKLSRGEPVDHKKLAETWLQLLDARYYIFFGDPFISMLPNP